MSHVDEVARLAWCPSKKDTVGLRSGGHLGERGKASAVLIFSTHCDAIAPDSAAYVCDFVDYAPVFSTRERVVSTKTHR